MQNFLQAQFSSSAFAQSYISLKSEKGWKPSVNNRQQYITVRIFCNIFTSVLCFCHCEQYSFINQVDFGSSREISGLTTKGVPGVGWVEAITLSYSRDGRQWVKILGKDRKTPRVFPTNFDFTTPVTQYLSRMVDARYLRISPARWHANIGMRLELLGCYKPYLIAITTAAPGGAFPTTQGGKGVCSSCPGLFPHPQSCSCPAGALFDGARCVADQECPCYVGQKRWRPDPKTLYNEVAGTQRVKCLHQPTVKIASVWELGRFDAYAAGWRIILFPRWLARQKSALHALSVNIIKCLPLVGESGRHCEHLKITILAGASVKSALTRKSFVPGIAWIWNTFVNNIQPISNHPNWMTKESEQKNKTI